MQAVTECTVLSSFCYQKKVSWHPLANLTHAGVKSFRLLKAICLIDGWPHSDRSRYHASTVQGPLAVTIRGPFAQVRMPLLKVFSEQPRKFL